MDHLYCSTIHILYLLLISPLATPVRVFAFLCVCVCCVHLYKHQFFVYSLPYEVVLGIIQVWLLLLLEAGLP
jgi:hypothetical protein